jgi:hypothetical protein
MLMRTMIPPALLSATLVACGAPQPIQRVDEVEQVIQEEDDIDVVPPNTSQSCENLPGDIDDIHLTPAGIAVATRSAGSTTMEVSLLNGSGCQLTENPTIVASAVSKLAGVDRFGGVFTIDLAGMLSRTDFVGTNQLSDQVVDNASIGEQWLLTMGDDGVGTWATDSARCFSEYVQQTAAAGVQEFAANGNAVAMWDGSLLRSSDGPARGASIDHTVRMLRAGGVSTWMDIDIDFGNGMEAPGGIKRCGVNACIIHDNGISVRNMRGELVNTYPLTLVESVRGDGDVLRTVAGDEQRGYYVLIYRLGVTRVLYIAPN